MEMHAYRNTHMSTFELKNWQRNQEDLFYQKQNRRKGIEQKDAVSVWNVIKECRKKKPPPKINILDANRIISRNMDALIR